MEYKQENKQPKANIKCAIIKLWKQEGATIDSVWRWLLLQSDV